MGMQFLMPAWDTRFWHQRPHVFSFIFFTHPFWHRRPHVFSFIFNHPSFLTPTSSCILIHLQSPILSDTNVLKYSHLSSKTHHFWHQRPHVFPFILNHTSFLTPMSSCILIHLQSPSFLTPTSSCILIHLQSPILSDTNVLMYSHSSSVTHPFWHQRPHVFSFIFSHSLIRQTASTITYSCQTNI